MSSIDAPTKLVHAGLPPALLLFVFGGICAMVMGYAIQRGSTCMVAAIDELLTARKATRLLSIIEASLWVTGGLLLVRATGGSVDVPQPLTSAGWAVAGGCLFGIGACINGACAFGTVARLGSGQWAYVFTPVGIFVGDLTIGHVSQMMAAAMPEGSRVLAAAGWLLVPLIGLVTWRVVGFSRSLASRAPIAQPWSAHGATTMVGITFLAMFVTVGPWAYTDILADMARGMGGIGDGRWILFVLLLAGAAVGGWRANLLRLTTPSARAVLRCAVGGFMMGWGSTLIPGGNDGLMLIGVPLLRSYAWIAMSAMTVAIVAALAGTRWWVVGVYSD
ncbi:hypothetical protein AX777_17305 [Sphingobium yanoikuyae]|jgi:toxin CptA|uniref:Uncharacterized protein n=1 Tax=Sphingobium yanoikuyae TaxID=13690 RepID=A0A177JVU8_SPHYA|nr:YeeE/YedE thiosulfate transporter family protein [Sphingobium yanoikuyae]OAH45369.1 hypothetical protein AX777_17305 [Sphingobium yanoikuyae]